LFKPAKRRRHLRLTLIVEDIGGSNLDERSSDVSSTLLNFLDGNDGIFKIPTLIIGTTNHLDMLSDSIISRPGRFDIVLQLQPMGKVESVKLAENFIKRELTESEKNAIATEGFTAAYIKEAIVRHRLDDISLEESVAQIKTQRKLSEEKTHKEGKSRRKTGFNILEDL
jgi:SpoVK/Ycf46/Vps4 family AAA+-type ATPase